MLALSTAALTKSTLQFTKTKQNNNPPCTLNKKPYVLVIPEVFNRNQECNLLLWWWGTTIKSHPWISMQFWFSCRDNTENNPGYHNECPFITPPPHSTQTEWQEASIKLINPIQIGNVKTGLKNIFWRSLLQNLQKKQQQLMVSFRSTTWMHNPWFSLQQSSVM